MKDSKKIWDELIPYLDKDIHPCIVCNSTKFEIWAKQGYLKALKCKDCGMISVNPHFSEEGLNYFYSNYFSYRQDDELLNKQRDETYLIDRDWVCNFVKNGDLLDIGCSGGFFLSKFPSKYYNREGVEVGSDAAKFAKENFNIHVHTGQVTEINFPKKYDLVMMRGVIEHFKDPIKVLNKCSKIIKKGGMLFLTATPAGDAFAFNVYRENWRMFTPLEHIHFFTVQILTKVLNDLGFEPVAHHYQYAETPYANVDQDFNKIKKDIIDINNGTAKKNIDSPPFPGSMFTALWKKVK